MIFRIVAQGAQGQIKIRDYSSFEFLVERHVQIGEEDCSTQLSLRGLPTFRGLIGPMPDGDGIARYETVDVFEKLTKEWASPRRKRNKKHLF